jgi:hypothetical protein
MAGENKSYHRVRISRAMRLDLSIWQIFLRQFNGVTYIPPDSWLDSSIIQLFTDSEGFPKLGFGCFNGHSFSGQNNQFKFKTVLLRIDNNA